LDALILAGSEMALPFLRLYLVLGLTSQKLHLTAITQSSLYLMEDRFSPKQIRRRRRQKLIEILR
jgi:hypothetical protein